MRTKSAYREKTAENISAAVEAAIAAPEAPAVAAEVKPEPQAETEAAHKYAEQVTTADQAAEALRRQVEALRASEALLRQAAQPQRPLTREEKLAVWQHQGMPVDQLEFLKANPELVDFSELAAFAANEAAQAHERGSIEHMRATKELFDRHMQHLQQQAQTNFPEPVMTATPKFFASPATNGQQQRPEKRVPVSAPVSREIPSGGPRSEYQQDPTKVHLSVAEKEIARNSGISEVEYARNKIKMLRMKATGEIQG
jgi:hypothetical protein